MSLPGFVPVRLCCGQRHNGARCPDGLVMCELCFDRFPDTELQRDEHDPSKRWNVCVGCAEKEARQIASRQ